ncbi:MAG: SAM-dependent methyltransferase [Proteobacteria bacterium]|nr:SAM-dependent methyltransferase [Pseudomonadota bacterium]
MTVPLDLPELTPEEATHSAALTKRIHADIVDEGGWIGFDRFMQLALYEPGLGYYSAGARKFGAAGDFITAPEVAPVFSRCLALQCAEVLRELGPESRLLELGAGSGAMAAELLAELERQGALPAAYWILDLSADLRERQRETLERAVPHLLPRVQWLDSLPQVPFTGMILANEVLDALTIERFAIRSGEVNALGVSSEFGQLQLAEVRAASRLVAAVRRIETDAGIVLPDGYESEVCTGLAGWFESIAYSLERGVLLFVDYGLPRREYYSAERTRGTLLCHFRHRFHEDALTRVGLQDITAWVDFTAVAEAAQAAGCELAGYTTQAHFLIGCGLGDFVANVEGLELVQRLNLSRQAMVLTLPGEMGERFKAIALSKDFALPLGGFAARDLRHSL